VLRVAEPLPRHEDVDLRPVVDEDDCGESIEPLLLRQLDDGHLVAGCVEIEPAVELERTVEVDVVVRARGVERVVDVVRGRGAVVGKLEASLGETLP
jgi:hypothetical protein